MPTRAQVCTWIAGCGLLMPSLVMAQDRTEREIVDLIVRDGPQARAIRADTEVTRLEQQARLAYPNPAVLYSRESAGFTEFLQAEQLLPVFGTRDALTRAGVSATAAAEAERDARLWLLRADAVRATSRLAGEQARLEAAEAYVRDVERLIEILRTREREGEGSRFDRLRAEQELRDARATAVAARVGISEARSTLASLLPRDFTVTRITDTPQTQAATDSLAALTERATASRAELRALQRSVERARLESDASRRARLPAPTIFGGWKRADVGLRSRSAAASLASACRCRSSIQEGATSPDGRPKPREQKRNGASIELQIHGEIGRAHETLALRQAALVEEPDAAGEELKQIAEVAYREGEVDILELLDAIRTAARARTRQIDLRFEVRLAQVALERAVGDILWP